LRSFAESAKKALICGLDLLFACNNWRDSGEGQRYILRARYLDTMTRSSKGKYMKFVVQAVFGFSMLAAAPAFSATAALAPKAIAASPAHVQAVQDLLGVMHVEYELRAVAARTRFPSEAQRKAVMAKLDKMTPAEVHRRLAPTLAGKISSDTALEMTRFYNTAYGKKLIQQKYNSGPQIMMPGMSSAVPPEEKKERKRAAYVQASKELVAAEPAIQHEAFKLLQALNSEKR